MDLAVPVVVVVAVVVVLRCREWWSTPVQDPQATSALLARPDEVPDIGMGELLLERVLETRWIHRRVDSLRFVEGERLRRRVSLDLEVPPSLQVPHRNEAFARDGVVLPLTYMAKRQHEEDQRLLRDLDIRDEQGRALPLLNRYENSLAAWAVLVAAARRAGQHLPQPEMDVLWEVVAVPAEVAHERALEVLGSAQRYPGIAAAAQQIAFVNLLHRFARDYLVLAHLPASGTGDRRIVKFAYDVPLKMVPLIPWPSGQWRRRDFVGLWLRGVAARLGLISLPLLFRLRSFVPASSFHFELLAPDDSRIVDAQLRAVTRYDATPQRDTAHAAPRRRRTRNSDALERWRTVRDNHLQTHRTITHLHLAGDAAMNAQFSARILLALRPDVTAWVALFAAVLLGALLWFGAENPARVMGSQEAAVSLLLLLPGLVAGAVTVRKKQHLVEQLLLGLRVGAIAMLLAASFAVATLQANAPGPGASDAAIQRSREQLGDGWARINGYHQWVILLLLVNVVPKAAVRPRRGSV